MTALTARFRQHPEYFWLAAIVICSTLLRLAFLHEPFELDEGQYATIAQEILRGGLPYRDAIEIKPPGTFYLYALAIALFGATTEAIRVFTALYATLTVVAVFGVVRLLAGVRAGLWAALVFGVFSTFPLLQGSGCNTEVFLLLPLTAGVWFLLKTGETRNRSFLFGAGLCAGLALVIKPVALPVVALELLLLPFLYAGPDRLKSLVPDLAAFLLPLAACALATFSYFYLRGGFDDLLYWTVEFPRSYRESAAAGPSLLWSARYLTSSLLVPVLVGIPTAGWLAVTRRDHTGNLPLLLLLAAALAVALPGKYFPHYFILLVPFLAIPAGIGLDRITRSPAGNAARLALVVVLVAAGFSAWENYRFFTTYSPETVSEKKYGVPYFVESRQVARYLKEHTGPDDYIFVWGMAPELYFLSDRRFPNPYLGSLLPGWSRDPRQASADLLQSLAEKRPAYIVVQNSWSQFPGIEEVTFYLQQHCSEETTIGYARLFRCSPRPGQTP